MHQGVGPALDHSERGGRATTGKALRRIRSLQVVKAVADVIRVDKVGLRLSPFANYNDCKDSNPQALGVHMAQSLNQLSVLYCNMIGGVGGGGREGAMGLGKNGCGEVFEGRRVIWSFSMTKKLRLGVGVNCVFVERKIHFLTIIRKNLNLISTTIVECELKV